MINKDKHNASPNNVKSAGRRQDNMAGSDEVIIEALEGKKNFKGYSLEELRYRLVVNRLKIAVTRDKLLLMTSPKMEKSANSISEYVSGFNSFFKYLDVAMVAYAITRRVTSVLRFFVPKRKNKN